jgi:flavin-dependent dehydrogenase
MIQNVIVVGGGTAGWMTAAYLKKAMRGLEVTVIESANIRSVGVGEGTFSTIKLFMDFLGLDEREWMPRCNASYKMGVRFVDWAARPGRFYHPFQRFETVDGFNLGEWWLHLKRGGEPFDYSCFTVPALCDAQRSPRFLDGTVFDDQVRDQFGPDATDARNTQLAEHRVQYPYAYHFDALLLAGFLKEVAIGMGVGHSFDDVVDVPLREDGSIARLVTAGRGPVEADLYVDCSGFRSLLIHQALGDPFLPCTDLLLCDSALAFQVPIDVDTVGLDPCTTTAALSSGWAWTVPLYGRLGTGYVYSSRFISREEAELEMRAYLGPLAEGVTANAIRMRVGRQAHPWVHNCVAVGLAAGFLEPLESSGIFMIQTAIEELVRHFPAGDIDPAVVRSYNRVVGEAADGVRDFLILHYSASDRLDTPFWRATKETALPDSLAGRMDLWRRRLPDHHTIPPAFHGFEAYSYAAILLGVNTRPTQESLPALSHLDHRRALEAFRAQRVRTERLLATLPSQVEYLRSMRGREADAGPRHGLSRRPTSLAGIA